MSTILLVLFMSASVSVFIYIKMSRRTGQGNAHDAVVAAAVSGVIIFAILLSLLKTLGL